uniref:Uncharacterized protein n=1 Tax=Ciona intestinalis TaxID=7719 RepID=H2XNK4_CIOIN
NKSAQHSGHLNPNQKPPIPSFWSIFLRKMQRWSLRSSQNLVFCATSDIPTTFPL